MKVTLAYAERQLRYFTNLVEKMRQTSDASDTERNEEGKEKFPPDPLIEKGQEEKKAHTHHARTREGIPSVEEVAAEVEATGSNIDPEYFVDFYLAHPKKLLVERGRVAPLPCSLVYADTKLGQVFNAVRKARSEAGRKEKQK